MGFNVEPVSANQKGVKVTLEHICLHNEGEGHHNIELEIFA